MTTVVVDSSVAVKWFVPENLWEPASRLLDDSYELLAPELLISEFGNVLWKKIGRLELTVEEAREILAAFRQVPLDFVAVSDLVDVALDVAVTHRRTVYDSLYMAAAMERNCLLVTADDRLVSAFAAGPLSAHVRSLSVFA